MNTKITLINTTHSFTQYEKHLPSVSSERQNRIKRFHFDKDKIISLFAELLMRSEISRQLDIPTEKIELGYSEHGKPFLMNYPNYYFSVSHSGNCIAFVSDKNPIGIDVEQIGDGNLDIAKRFFTENEFEFIRNSKEPKLAFYQIWTAKEAYVKMLGLGLSKSFNSFDVLSDKLKSCFSHQQISEYMLTVCTEFNNSELTIEEIQAENLLK